MVAGGLGGRRAGEVAGALAVEAVEAVVLGVPRRFSNLEAAGRPFVTLAPKTDRVWAVAFGPDSKALVSAGEDGMVRFWDVATGKELRRWAGHRYEVLGVAFAPDGTTVASGGTDGTARLWDVAGGKERRRWTVDESGVLALAFTKDGKGIVTADGHHRLQLWDADSGKAVRSFDGAGPERMSRHSVLCGAVAPDGQTVALGYEDGANAAVAHGLAGLSHGRMRWERDWVLVPDDVGHLSHGSRPLLGKSRRRVGCQQF